MTLGVTDDQNYSNIADALREMGSGAEDLAFRPGEIAAAIRGLRSIWGTIEGSILDQTDLQNALNGKSAANHNHDSRYYTESEINTKLNGKSNTNHTHDDRYYTETEIDTKLNGKSNINHTHDERYYTEAEIDNKFDENTIIKSASGPIVSFNDGVAAPTGNVTVAIEPVQEGTGDPSPENVRPITGWTGVKVMRTGKNLINYESWKTVDITRGTSVWENNGVTLTATEQSDVGDACFTNFNYNAFPLSARIPVKVGQTYTLSWKETSNKSGEVYIFGNGVSGKNVKGNNANVKSISYTVPNGITFITFRFGVTNVGDTISYKDIQLELGSTVTAYEPYQGDTYDISFGSAGTVYGGSLDVSSGKLTVDRVNIEMQTMNSSLWRKATASDTWNLFYIKTELFPIKYDTNGECYCSHFKHMPAYREIKQDYGKCNLTSDLNFSCDPEICGSTSADWVNWINAQKNANTPLQISLKLATPLTYQLTPTEVTTLLGQNNIWADTGDVDVSYFTSAGEDVGKAFDNVSKSSKYDDDKTREMITQSSESAMTASKNYTAGNLIIINDKLLRATANIASGGTITIGTNAEEVDLETVISEKVNSYADGASGDTIDLNNYVYTGFYSIYGSNLNSPDGTSSNGNLLVIRGTGFIHQIAFIGNDAIWMRRKTGGNWNAWKKFTGA